MRSVPVPQVGAVASYAAAVAYASGAEAAEWKSIAPLIKAAEDNYLAAGLDRDFTKIPIHLVVGAVPQAKFSLLYEDQLASASGTARQVYNLIREGAPFGICPLCGIGKVSTLDHFLPKRRYPSLAVTPANLVPCCKDCNLAKGQRRPTTLAEQFFHPYFDDVNAEVWVSAEIVEAAAPIPKFCVNAPAGWTAQAKARAEFHFEKLKLAQLFAANAAQSLSEMKHQLVTLLNLGGAEMVRLHLQEEYVSCSKTSKNSWRTTLHAALTKSDWFCETGCALISE